MLTANLGNRLIMAEYRIVPILAAVLKHHAINLDAFMADFPEGGYPHIASDVVWLSHRGNFRQLLPYRIWVRERHGTLEAEMQFGPYFISETDKIGRLKSYADYPAIIRTVLPGKLMSRTIDGPLFKNHNGVIRTVRADKNGLTLSLDYEVSSQVVKTRFRQF